MFRRNPMQNQGGDDRIPRRPMQTHPGVRPEPRPNMGAVPHNPGMPSAPRPNPMAQYDPSIAPTPRPNMGMGQQMPGQFQMGNRPDPSTLVDAPYPMPRGGMPAPGQGLGRFNRERVAQGFKRVNPMNMGMGQQAPIDPVEGLLAQISGRYGRR